MSYSQIAEKGEVSVEFILEQVIDGMIVEAEHTDDPAKAREIAMDHLFESPLYYSELRDGRRIYKIHSYNRI